METKAIVQTEQKFKGTQEKKLASFSAPCKYIDDALALIKQDHFLEWDLNTLPFSLNTKRMSYVRDFIKAHGEVRFHLPHGFWDLGVQDENVTSDSYNYYCRLFRMIKFLEASVVVIHVGAASDSDEETAIAGITKLVDEAQKYNVKLCIENLIHGLPSDMSFVKRCLQIEGLYFCLDIGHAECLRRKNGNQIYNDILSVKDKILHAHVYDVEDDTMNHIPFTNETLKTNLWLPLLDSAPCNWYTMELETQNDQNHQKKLLKDYLCSR